MFESWPIHFEPPVRRVVEPPAPVIVDLAAGIARSPLAAGVALRVRGEGLRLDMKVPATLHAWARTTRGDWLGLIHVRIPTGNGAGYLDAQQWFPAVAITRTDRR